MDIVNVDIHGMLGFRKRTRWVYLKKKLLFPSEILAFDLINLLTTGKSHRTCIINHVYQTTALRLPFIVNCSSMFRTAELLVLTHIHKTEATGNDTHQNALATWMKRSTSNIILIYKAILKPMWTYGIQLWGAAFTSNIEILEHFQSKVLRMIEDAPWYVPNTVIRRDLQTPTIKEEIHHHNTQYSVRLSVHPNDLVANFMAQLDNR
jgi:hypothetical protein